jgi:hypothetical protein
MTAVRRWADVLRRGRGAWIVLFGAGLVLAGASAASAYWTVTATLGPASTAAAKAGTLSAPTLATATQTGSGAVTVGWTNPATQLPGALNRVTRATGPGSPLVVCTTVSSATSCADTGLSAGVTYTYTVAAVMGTNWQSGSVSISTTTLGVTTSALASGTVGTTYSSSLSAVGGTGPYTWTLTAGTLPLWATLNAGTGAITGVPNAAGTTSGLQFTVTDAVTRTATTSPLTLTVGPGSQTITFTSTSPGSAVVGVGSYTPTATSSSGLPVSLSIDGTSAAVCTMSAGVVTYTGSGSCIIDANQPGDANYAAAAQMQQSITVTKLLQTISFPAPGASSQMAGTTVTPTATASSGLAVAFSIDSTSTSVCDILGGVVTLRALGTCRINANQAGNATYEAAPQVQQAITVTRGNQVIALTVPIDAGVGGTWTPVPTTVSNLPVTWTVGPTTVCKVNTPGIVSFVGAGNCTITSNQAGNANFFPAPQLVQLFEVSTPAGLGLVLAPGSTGAPVLSCSVVSANRTCTISGVDLSGSANFSVVVLSSTGHRVVFSYSTSNVVTETGQNTGSATISSGTSITTTTLTAGHVGNATKTSVLTFGTYKLTLDIAT